MWRVFRLAGGVYALGVGIRLLQRRSGPASARPAAPGAARRRPVAEIFPDGALAAHPEADDRVGPAPRPDWDAAAPPARDEAPLSPAPSTPGNATATARSEFDPLPRERLFELAHGAGHSLEDLITMGRDELIELIVRVERERERASASTVARITHPGADPNAVGPVPKDPGLTERAG